MEKDRHSGLKKAYSSQLSIVQQGDEEYILKKVDEQERRSELFFQEQLKLAVLPAMEVELHEEGLLVGFVSDAHTLEDEKTSKLYEKLGAELSKLHSITFPSPFYLDEAGKERRVEWREFVENRLAYATTRQAERSGFDEDLAVKIKGHIAGNLKEFTSKPALLHGDLHSNNVLVKDEKLILFDKADHIMAGDPMYDLAMFGITLPGAVYGVGGEVEKDSELFEAFRKGYGSDFTRDANQFNSYVLLRCFERWPNPFEKEIHQIVGAILAAKS